MSGAYAYCVTPGGSEPPPDVRGIGGRGVFLVERGGLALWLGPSDEKPRPTVENVREHNAVVEAAWRSCEACVPFRFGQWFGSPDAAAEAAEQRGEELGGALERVRGMVEFGVRVLQLSGEGGSGDPPERMGSASGRGPGTAYMTSLRRKLASEATREERARDVKRALLERSAGLIAEDRVSPPTGEDGVWELAHLVPRGSEEGYREAVHEVEGRFPGLELLVTGPWPPYSFGP